MPIAKIQLEDGRIAKFEVPEGSTEADVLEFASTQDFSNIPSPEPVKEKQGAPVFGLAQQYGTPATKENPIGIPEFVTGQARGRYEIERQGLPEVISTNPNLSEGLKIVGTFMAESDPKKRADMMSNLGFEIERVGEVDYVKRDGERVAVVNKPGWSRSDVLELGSVIAKYAPAARITGMARGLLAKVGLGAATAGATSVIEEASQEALGGEFSGTDVAISSALGAGGELLAAAGGKMLSKLSAKAREKALNAKTVDELRRLGVSEEDLRETAANIRARSAEATELGVSQPYPAEVMTDKRLGAQVRSEVREPAKVDLPRAAEIEESVAKRGGELKQSIQRSFGRYPEANAADAMRRARDVAEDIISSERKTRKGLAEIAYSRAWEGADMIDPDPIIKRIVDVAEKQRVPEVKKALRDRAWMLDSESGITAEEAQQIVWDIRDEFAKKAGGSIKSQVRKLLGDVEKDIVASINKATEGKYSQADKLYSSLSKDLETLVDSKVGQAAGKKDVGLDTVLDSIFKPKPVNRQLSKEFMKRMADQNPDAAADLYQAYFTSKLDSISPDAKPSEIVKAIYGGEGEAQNMIALLAPDEKTANRLMKIRRQLEAARTFEDVSSDVAASAEFKEKSSKGIANLVGKLFTPGFSVRHGLEGVTNRHKNKILFNAATNSNWARRLDEIADIMKTNENAATELWGGLVKEINETLLTPEQTGAMVKASVQEANNE